MTVPVVLCICICHFSHILYIFTYHQHYQYCTTLSQFASLEPIAAYDRVEVCLSTKLHSRMWIYSNNVPWMLLIPTVAEWNQHATPGRFIKLMIFAVTVATCKARRTSCGRVMVKANVELLGLSNMSHGIRVDYR